MAADGILVALETLVVSRGAEPVVLAETPAALRRIGWIGRPVVLAGTQVGVRQLPPDMADREAWVRAALGTGAFAVVPFEPQPSGRGGDGGAREVETWASLQHAFEATWLLTDLPDQVGPARRAGLKVILIGPAASQPGIQPPNYWARDLRDAVGHLLAADVFSSTG
jgi:hypothetical protein